MNTSRSEPLQLFTPADKSRHAQLVTLVDQLLDLHRQLQAAKTPDERMRAEPQVHIRTGVWSGRQPGKRPHY